MLKSSCESVLKYSSSLQPLKSLFVADVCSCKCSILNNNMHLTEKVNTVV